jgi:hypothetical protein
MIGRTVGPMSRWATFSGDELDAVRDALFEWSGPKDPENDLPAASEVFAEVEK